MTTFKNFSVYVADETCPLFSMFGPLIEGVSTCV